MALQILYAREKAIAAALNKAAMLAGVPNTRPLKVLAIYLDSAVDLAKVHQEAKRELGVAEVLVLPAPIHLDLERMTRIESVLKKYGLSEPDTRRAIAEIVKDLS